MQATLSIVRGADGKAQTIAVCFRPTNDSGVIIDGRLITLAFDAQHGAVKLGQDGTSWAEYSTYSPAVGVSSPVVAGTQYVGIDALASVLANLQ